jgi:hypothetical protein
MTRPTGCLRDPIGCGRGEDIALLVPVSAAGRDVPESSTLEYFVVEIHDQTGQSCVGHALAQCLRVRAAVLGRTIAPSAMAIYAVARELDRPGVTPLLDHGSFPAMAIEGLSDWGAVDEARWPDDSPIAESVPSDVLEAGALAHVSGEYRIDSDVKNAVKRAVSAGYPVFFAMAVDATYSDYPGGVWRGISGEITGGHAQVIVGYDSESVTVANSWGRGWGEQGLSRVEWGVITGRDAYDFYIITCSPNEVT